MKKWLRRKFINWLVKDIFFGIQREEVFAIRNGKVYVAGEPITPQQVQKLAKDAEVIQNMYLWELLQRELEYHSFDRGWKKAQTEEDMIVGKMLLYYKDLVDRKLLDMAKGWYTSNKGNGNR